MSATSPGTPTLPWAPGGPIVPGVRRIAVLRANGIGDFALALPALLALRAAYPGAEITYLGAGWHPELLSGRPGPWDRAEAVPPYPGVREGTEHPVAVQEFFDRQRARRYDLAIQLHGGGAHSNPFVSALGAGVSVGSQDRGAARLDRTVPYTPYQHEVLRFLEVVGLVGAEPTQLEPRLHVTPSDDAEAEHALARALPDVATAGTPLVAVHPGASDPRRRWPPTAFAEVCRYLAEAGAQLVMIGHGTDDERAAKTIAAAVPAPTADLVGRLSLPALVGLLHRCHLLIANDSGPRHLAAAVGTATVGIFWCGNVITAGPLTRARHRIAVSFRTACPVCGAEQSRDRCPHDPSFVAEVPVEEVLEPALELFAATAPEQLAAFPGRDDAW